MDGITERYIQLINQLIKDKSIKDGKEFALTIGVSVSSITEITKGRSKVGLRAIQKTVLSFPDVNSDWLLNGEGEIFKTKTPKNVINDNDDIIDDVFDDKRKLQKTSSIKSEALAIFHGEAEQQIPVYELQRIESLGAMLKNQHTATQYVSLPNLPKCDGAVYMRGDMMSPEIKSGDIIVFKQVKDLRKGLFLGQIYLLSLNLEGEEYIVVQRIQQGDMDDHVKLVSTNTQYPSQNVKRDSITAAAMIKASVRYNTMV